MIDLDKYTFLQSFFLLFRANIERIRITKKSIYGTLGWGKEEDKQEFKWSIQYDDNIFFLIKLLCDFLLKNNLIIGDKIKITEDQLRLKLIDIGWKNEDVERSINYLMSLEIKMLDDGEETDSFFIHF